MSTNINDPPRAVNTGPGPHAHAPPNGDGKVQSGQRFNRDHPCPICGGSNDERRGTGERCFGFLSSNGEWANCTREEHAGLAPFNPVTEAYPHLLKGKCPCGTEHAPADPKPKRPKVARRTVAVYAYFYCHS